MYSILELIKMAAEGKPYTPSVGKEIRIEIPKPSKKEENQNESSGKGL